MMRKAYEHPPSKVEKPGISGCMNPEAGIPLPMMRVVVSIILTLTVDSEDGMSKVGVLLAADMLFA